MGVTQCVMITIISARRDGCCAEFVIAPQRNLLLPDKVTLEDASVLEPASVTLHGLDKRVIANDDVVVLGVATWVFLPCSRR